MGRMVESDSAELAELRQRAQTTVKGFSTERLIVLNDELRMLRAKRTEEGVSPAKIMKELLEHAVTPEAGMWSASFVQRVLGLGEVSQSRPHWDRMMETVG